MAYIAMARKWRPESFNDLVGQEHIAKTIENAIVGGRLHHAFLFTGTRGVGKTTSARILAKTLNCTGGDPLVPCGKCKSCLDIASGHPMDVIEIDAASNTGVDNIRDLLEQTQYTPMIGKYKVFVIDEVHMLSKGAFNALLKTLEEPPPHVIFIFATTEVNKVPQTILSRVQRFDFKRLTTKQITSRLKYICEQESISTDAEALGMIAEKADGSMRDALTFFDQAYAFTGNDMNADSVRSVLGVPPNDLYFALLESIEKHDLKGTFAVVDKASETGVEFAPLLDGFAKFVRNRLYVKVGGISAEELNISEGLYEKLNSCAPSLGNGDLLRIARILTDLQGNIRRSTNPRLLVESAFARMAYLDRVVDLKRALAAINDPASQGSKKKLTEPQTQALAATFTAPAPVPQAAPAPAAPSDSPFTIDFDSFDAPKASEPAPTVDFGGPEMDSSMVIDFGGAPAFDDEHGLDDAPNFVGSSDDFGGEQSITRYDICNSWQQLIRSSFSQEMGFFATSLNGSTLEHGDFQENPFRLKVVYPASFKWGYDQMMTREDYRERLANLLEDRLQTKVSVTYELLEPKPGEEVSGVPLSPWESDLQKEPGLAEFTQRFMAELVASRSAPKNLDEENSDGEPCAVTPEQE
ncbi:MAG: DNA polymerase III subunit gamma/tau [Fibrobacter sp.]|nr:DNA polymerase III subunit gamma/tau [Fibrobacter sp.]MDY6369830.1 DNA polymerase III subunit gamma/tau [Fibrobacter sp.]MDY6390260.1 DNA polymerase III subunit gamma/tau [Fibrobacter sp.]